MISGDNFGYRNVEMKISKRLMYIAIIYLNLEGPVAGEETFVASFQKDIIGVHTASTTAWMNFSNPIPESKEFTVCHWIQIKFFNQDIAACLWSYCTIDKISERMECLQVCMQAMYETANRNLKFEGVIDLEAYNGTYLIRKGLNSYRHRTWTHICWSFSALTGMSKVYQNGKLLDPVDQLHTTHDDMPLKSSNSVTKSAFIFGQDPDNITSGFDSTQAYLGLLSELNMWNYTLNDEDVLDMASCKTLPKGNIVSWDKSIWTLHNVFLEDVDDRTTF